MSFRAGGGVVRVGNLYLPNGNPIGTDKFAYKLAWMKRLQARARDLLELEEPLLLVGDYNVIPEPVDAKNPERLDGGRAVPARDARRLSRPAEPRTHRRGARLPSGARRLHVLGLPGGRLAEGPRHPHRPHAASAAGRRPARGRPASTSFTRGWEKPSDHVPVWVELAA